MKISAPYLSNYVMSYVDFSKSMITFQSGTFDIILKLTRFQVYKYVMLWSFLTRHTHISDDKLA